MKPGHCYANCLLALHGPNFYGATDLRLCHGYPRLQVESNGHPAGTRYGHAWIEGTVNSVVLCFNFEPDGVYMKAAYYVAGDIEEQWVTRYDIATATALAAQHGTSGPWSDPHPEAVFAND